MEENKPLEISFRREMKQNYLMIAAEEELEHGFEARMLAANTIDGLLKFRVRRENDRLWFCYEISSKQPLSRILDRTSIQASQIRRLLLGIAQTLARMEDYLLSERLVLLDADYIYVDPDEFLPGLCLLPGRQGDFPQEFSRFLQFLLGRTDHQDKEAVVLIYGLYQESLKENYGLDNLLRWLMKEDYPNQEYRNEEEKSGRIQAELEEDPLEDGEIGPDAAYREAPHRAEPRGSPSSAKKLLAYGLIPLLAAVLLWLFRGKAGLAEYGVPVIGASLILAAVCAAWRMWAERRESGRSKRLESGRADRQESGRADRRRGFASGRRGTAPASERETWEMVFADEQEQPDHEEPARFSGVSVGTEQYYPQAGAGARPGSDPPPAAEDPSHTTLLWSRPAQADIRRLAGEAGTEETIPVAYFPFLIGKQGTLADYILPHDTISRLHVRIDRKGDTYWLTDLNSTNGTTVNGRLLQANETVPLNVGDHVDLADLHFQFL